MADEIDVYEEDPGKILKRILRTGHGNVIVPCASVSLHYTGRLLDGTKVDSSWDRFELFRFQVGVGNVIKGLDVGICTMRTGEHAILTIDSKYGFKDEGNPPQIPPDTVLQYEIDIIDWNYEDSSPNNDGTIEKRIVTTLGNGFVFPKIGEYLEVHIRGKFNSEVLEDRDLIFRLGYGREEQVAKGVELALEKFRSGEKSTIFMTPNHAENTSYFENIRNLTGRIQYEIELKRFEISTSSWLFDYDTAIKQAEMFKAKGNQIFKQEKLNEAIELYKKMAKCLSVEGKALISKRDGLNKFESIAYSNKALCYLKMKDYKLALDAASTAVSLDSNNVKAHYRSGMASFGLSDFKDAKLELEKCLEIDPNNSEAESQLFRVIEAMKRHSEAERNRFRSLFTS